MGIPEHQFRQMQERLARQFRPRGSNENTPTGVDQEIPELHYPIIKWCREQWPPVPYIHARTDSQSTIAEGAPDFVIFYRGNAILVECKTAIGKLSTPQLAWIKLLHDQGFEVSVVRSMQQFHDLIKQCLPSSPANSAPGPSPSTLPS